MALPTPGVTPANWGAQLNAEINGVKWSFTPEPTSGDYVGSAFCFGNTTDTSVSLGDMNACPIYVAADLTFTAVAMIVDTATATAVHRLGIYASTSRGLPGTLVIDAGTVNSATTGVKTATISQPLTSGLYWCVAVPQVALARHRGFSNLHHYPQVGPSNLIIQTPGQNFFRVTGVTGALPSSPTWTFNGAASASQVPIVGLVV